MNGYKFRRQYSIGPYIADFYCPEVKLTIGVDGSVHDSIGINIPRFKNNEIENNIDAVIDKIEKQLERLS
ncbi:MAG: DUF559 domain-containing protein [Spirochaetes bacterium]|nr:DUF559 domain-containing protein [Spirochaetota bacterium]